MHTHARIIGRGLQHTEAASLHVCDERLRLLKASLRPLTPLLAMAMKASRGIGMGCIRQVALVWVVVVLVIVMGLQWLK